MTFCTTPGCGELVPGGKCATHRAEVEKRRRDRETWRDYDSAEWKQARAYVLRVEPLCRFCGDTATVVDHVIPLKDGGSHAITNLRPLCKSCHDRRTHADTLGRRNQRKQP